MFAWKGLTILQTPYYTCASGPASFYADPPTARESIKSLMEFDADPNVLVRNRVNSFSSTLDSC